MGLVLDEKSYVGLVKFGEFSAPVTFRMGAGADCRLWFDLDAVDSKTYVQLAKALGQTGESVTWFSLSGESEDGFKVSSDSVHVIGLGGHVGAHKVRIAANAAVVTHSLTEEVAKPLLRLWFRGFQSFRNSPVETPLGTLLVSGLAKDVGRDDASGCVAVQAANGQPAADWRANADELLRHMHRGLSFAHGGRLQTPLLEYVAGNEVAATFFAGSGFAAEFAIQHFLNQDPIIKALVARYFAKGPLPDALWTALGWMQSDTTFDEIRFLTAMTALETIAESELTGASGTVMPKATYKPIRAALNAAVDLLPRIPEAHRVILKSRIAGLNRRTFAEKIDALFDQYAIPRDDLGPSVIAGLVVLRNDIVHRGMIPEGVAIWPQIILVRELITRILLSEIGFVGRYCCYIGGQHDRDFPAPELTPNGELGGTI